MTSSSSTAGWADATLRISGFHETGAQSDAKYIMRSESTLRPNPRAKAMVFNTPPNSQTKKKFLVRESSGETETKEYGGPLDGMPIRTVLKLRKTFI